jgi:hypothetical protein
MTKQVRNPESVNLQSPDFLRREEFYQDGARIWDALYGTHREGGGRIRWAWQADGPSLWTSGDGVVTMNEVSLADSNYAATANGGPYVNLDGANDWLDVIGVNPWQEPGAEEFLVWSWCNLTDHLSTHEIISKWDNSAAGTRSWDLGWGIFGGRFYMSIYDVPAGLVRLVWSTYPDIADTWYFVAGYFVPATLMRIFVGAATDSVLTIDSNVLNVPNSIQNVPAAPLTIGAAWNVYPGGPTFWWWGKIGIIGGRCNVPSAAIDGHVSRLFHLTRALYQ